MTDKKAMRLLNLLATAIHRECPDVQAPTVFCKDGDWATHTLAWDGPFEWTMITCGSSIYAGELGNYSLLTESRIQKALDTIRDEGGFLECINNSWLGLYDA